MEVPHPPQEPDNVEVDEAMIEEVALKAEGDEPFQSYAVVKKRGSGPSRSQPKVLVQRLRWLTILFGGHIRGRSESLEHLGWTRAMHGIAASSYFRLHRDNGAADLLEEENM